MRWRTFDPHLKKEELKDEGLHGKLVESLDVINRDLLSLAILMPIL
jgi:hypothetical protein